MLQQNLFEKTQDEEDVAVLERLFGEDNIFFAEDGHVVVTKQQRKILFELTIDPVMGKSFSQEGEKTSLQ